MPPTPLDLSALANTLAQLTATDDIVIALIQSFAAEVTAHAGDAAAVTAIAAQYQAEAQRLADAAAAAPPA